MEGHPKVSARDQILINYVFVKQSLNLLFIKVKLDITPTDSIY